MKRTIKQSSTLLILLFAAGSLTAAERPTLNKTCDPRPDILPHPIYYAHKEYRLEYNRPRYLSGWIAHKIAPSSQEAMVWCENNRAGNYQERNMPPMYKRYFAPKPWEVLQTGARPDFVRNQPNVPTQPRPTTEAEAVPPPVEDLSPSDINNLRN